MSDDWEGGERPGIRWRRVGLVLLVVALVAGGVVVVRRERGLSVDTGNTPVVGSTEPVDIVATAPLRRAGALWACPSTHPVRAYDDGLYYYPEGYPESGLDLARPDSCFEDAARAAEGGYRLAPPPLAAVLTGGLYLVPTIEPSTQTCIDLAADVGIPVPCPGILPAPAVASACESGTCLFRDGVIFEQRSFEVSEGWALNGDRIMLTAAPLESGTVIRRGQALNLDAPELVTCAAGEEVKPQGERVFRECPTGEPWHRGWDGLPHEDHTAAFWRRGRVVYGASVAGSGPDVEEVLEAVISGIRYVGADGAE